MEIECRVGLGDVEGAAVDVVGSGVVKAEDSAQVVSVTAELAPVCLDVEASSLLRGPPRFVHEEQFERRKAVVVAEPIVEELVDSLVLEERMTKYRWPAGHPYWRRPARGP